MEDNPRDAPGSGMPEVMSSPVSSIRNRLLVISGCLIVTALIAFGWWKSGERHRQIENWSQAHNGSALLDFVRDHYPVITDKPEVVFAFQKFVPLAQEKDLAALEAFFYQVTAGDDIELGILQIFKKYHRPFMDPARAVTWWIGYGSHPGPLETEMQAMLVQLPAKPVQQAFLAEIGRRYAGGDKPGAIEVAHSYAKIPPAPEASGLVELLTAYSNGENLLGTLHQKIQRLESEIEDQKERVAQYHFVMLSAFLVDRLPNIGDNVYEIGTFSWSDYSGLRREETAILTCNGTVFNSKGRFTMAVRPTGMKTFSSNSGGSASLPTFEEVPRRELAEKEAAEYKLMSLYSEKNEAQKEISKLEELMSQANAAIKTKLGWNEQVSTPSIDTNTTSEPLQNESENHQTVEENSDKVIRAMFDSWMKDSQIPNTDLSKYYADTFQYYNAKNYSKTKLIEARTKFWDNHSELKLTLSDIKFIKIDSDNCKFEYDKEFNSKNSISNKIYQGKVKSIIEFKKIGDNWKIVTEKDEKTYYTSNK